MEYEMKEKIAEKAYDEAGKGDYPAAFSWAVFTDKQQGIPKIFVACFVLLGAIVMLVRSYLVYMCRIGWVLSNPMKRTMRVLDHTLFSR